MITAGNFGKDALVEQSDSFLNKYVVPPLTALSENTYMSAIRAGMVAVVPMTIIGGLFLIIAEFPSAWWKTVIAPYSQLLRIPVHATFDLLSVFVCFALGYELGKLLKQEAIVSAAMATIIFLMVQINIQPAHSIEFSADQIQKLSAEDRAALREEGEIAVDSAKFAQLAAQDPARPGGAAASAATLSLTRTDFTLNLKGLGTAGLFTAIVIAIIAVRVQKFFTDANLVIRLPESVPSMVYESFLSLCPLTFLIVVFWLIRFVLGLDINNGVQTLFSPLVFALNTLPGILVYAFMVTMLWSVGINGDNAMDAIVAPIFLQYLGANVDALNHGDPLPYVTAYGFFTAFVNVGGTGATLGLALTLINSREPGFRKVARLSLPTQIFQINEPIFFGMPIVLNPIFMVPYVLNALLLTTCSYLLMDWNIIQRPFVNVPWTTPPIIGHYLVTGGDWRAAVWGAVSIVIAMTVYYPFAKIAERGRLAAEAAGTAHE